MTSRGTKGSCHANPARGEVLFQAIKFPDRGKLRAGVNTPAGLVSDGSEPRGVSMTAPKLSDRPWPNATRSAAYAKTVWTLPLEFTGVLYSTTDAGAPATVLRLRSEGAVIRLRGEDNSQLPPTVIW